jgi:NADP-dependent 3-hydroxy acid dehydrogenase YdfG
MKNQLVLITGATAGIGRECAKQLAQMGHHLILCGRRKERLEALRNEIGPDLVRALLDFDIRDRKEVQEGCMQLMKQDLIPDVLINNAGLAAGLSALAEGTVDDWEQMIDTNVKGLLYMSRELLPAMISRQSGHVINIGSIAGKEVYDKGNVYCGTKHMVDALSKSMRLELADHGIKVSAIHPGAVDTEFSIVRFKGDVERAIQVYEGFDSLLAEDIAECVVWILGRPEHVNINDLVIMPKAQPSAAKIVRGKGF